VVNADERAAAAFASGSGARAERSREGVMSSSTPRPSVFAAYGGGRGVRYRGPALRTGARPRRTGG